MRHKSDIFSGSFDFGCADGEDEIFGLGFGGEGERLAVEDFVFEDYDGVGVADGCFHETFCVLGVNPAHACGEMGVCTEMHGLGEEGGGPYLRGPGRDDFETRNGGIPRGIVLRVLSSYTSGSTIRSSERNIARLNSTGHVQRLCSRIDNLINSLHSKIPRHKFTYRQPPTPTKRPTYRQV